MFFTHYLESVMEVAWSCNMCTVVRPHVWNHPEIGDPANLRYSYNSKDYSWLANPTWPTSRTGSISIFVCRWIGLVDREGGERAGKGVLLGWPLAAVLLDTSKSSGITWLILSPSSQVHQCFQWPIGKTLWTLLGCSLVLVLMCADGCNGLAWATP